MTPEAERYARMAHAFLAKAEGMRAMGWPDEAGRASYLAAFHAAQAAIFETRGICAKTHQGVHTEFARIVRDFRSGDRETWLFLRRAYNLKTNADYGTGPIEIVTDAEAAAAIDAARRFVEQLLAAIASPSGEPT